MRTLLTLALAAALAACATIPNEPHVAVIGIQHAAPTGCVDLGEVALGAASMLTWNPVAVPGADTLKLLAAAKGGDTMRFTSAFPLKGEAYRCGS